MFIFWSCVTAFAKSIEIKVFYCLLGKISARVRAKLVVLFTNLNVIDRKVLLNQNWSKWINSIARQYTPVKKDFSNWEALMSPNYNHFLVRFSPAHAKIKLNPSVRAQCVSSRKHPKWNHFAQYPLTNSMYTALVINH